MQANRHVICWLACGLTACGLILPAWAGQAKRIGPPGTAAHASNRTTPLRALLAEAAQHNRQIRAAWLAWRAARHRQGIAAALPAPSVEWQSFSVGNPLPGAGLENNNFAYFGLGASQTLPYPGKLRLRGELAKAGASERRARWRAERRQVGAQVENTYFQLAYLQQTLRILHQEQTALSSMEKIAEARYASGAASEADVLRAQAEETKLLRETAMHHADMDTAQAELRELLARPASSPPVKAARPSLVALPGAARQIESRLEANPLLSGQRARVRQRSLRLALAKKHAWPDLKLSYMYQMTGTRFPDYYMLSLGVKLPFLWGHKQRQRVAEAAGQLAASRETYQGRLYQLRYRLEAARLTAHANTEIAAIYQRGRIPQLTAAYRSSLAAYQSGRVDFETLLRAFLGLLSARETYWRAVSQQASAVAAIEALAGNYP